MPAATFPFFKETPPFSATLKHSTWLLRHHSYNREGLRGTQPRLLPFFLQLLHCHLWCVCVALSSPLRLRCNLTCHCMASVSDSMEWRVRQCLARKCHIRGTAFRAEIHAGSSPYLVSLMPVVTSASTETTRSCVLVSVALELHLPSFTLPHSHTLDDIAAAEAISGNL